MSTKQELLSKFASQTGAVLPGIQSKPNNHTDTNISSKADDAKESTTVQEDEELFKDSFSDRTKVPAWQNPKYKGLIVALCVVPVVVGVGWIFKDGVPKPKFDTKAPSRTPVAQNPDEDQPKAATDGEWASITATNGMRQQFASAAESRDADALKKNQDQANSQKKTQDNSSIAKSNTRSVNSVVTETNTPSYRTASRPYTPPTSMRTQTNAPSYSPVTRSYTPPTPSFSTNQYRAVTPTVRTVKPSRLTANQSSAQPQSQRSPQERVAAIISATSTGASTETVSVASTAMPVERSRVISHASRPLGIQPTSTSTQQDNLPSETAVIDGQPQTLINRSQSAKGKLLTSIAFTSGDYASLANQPVEIELSEALGDISKGTRIVAVVETTQSNDPKNSKSQVVRLKPTALVVDNMEIPLPDGAIMLSGKNGSPLVAKRGGSGFLRFLGGLTGTIAGGAGLTNFGASQNVQVGDSSYFQSIGANVATSLVSNAAQQLRQVGEGDEILILKAGSSITVSVHKPFVLPQITEVSDTQIVGKSEALPELAFQVLTDTIAMQGLADFQGAADATQN